MNFKKFGLALSFLVLFRTNEAMNSVVDQEAFQREVLHYVQELSSEQKGIEVRLHELGINFLEDRLYIDDGSIPKNSRNHKWLRMIARLNSRTLKLILAMLFGAFAGILLVIVLPVNLKTAAIFLAVLLIVLFCLLGFGQVFGKMIQEKKEADREANAKQRLEKLILAEDLLKRNDIKNLICPALQSVVNDAFEYSKIITPILIGAIVTKTVLLPLDACLFAALAVIISRSGVSIICSNNARK